MIETKRDRSYYRNSLEAERTRLLKCRVALMARYERMGKQSHPDKLDQGYLLEINLEMIGIIDRSLAPLKSGA